MDGYSESALLSKLSSLNNSPGSIQGLSLWLIHHRKHYESIARVWAKQLRLVSTEKKLSFVYLANDVVQNARKKSPELGKEFGSCMVAVFQHLASLNMERKMVGSLGRVVKVWRERDTFQAEVLHEVSEIWAEKLTSCQEEEEESRPPPLKRSRESSPEAGSPVTLSGGGESACRASLELCLQLLSEVERAGELVAQCREEQALPRLVSSELMCRSRLAQLLAGVLAKQQEGVEQAESRLKQLNDNR